MGYSHYFYRPKELNSKKFKEFTNDCKKIFEYSENQLGIELANGMGDINSDPKITSNLLCFNGSNTQPIGVFTTMDKISIPWFSSNANLTESKQSPTADKTDGQWFAGDYVSQRVAPTKILNVKEIVEKLYEKVKDKKKLSKREKRFLTKYSEANEVEFGSGENETVYIERKLSKEDIDWQLNREEKRELFFGCCKTACRPYDLIVTAVFIALKHHFSECVIRSDGEDKDWQDGRILCQNLLGYGIDFSVDKE